MFAHSDISFWLKKVELGSATFNMVCSARSNNDSAFLLRRAKDYFRVFFFAAYVSKDHWLKITIETDKSTSVNDHVLDKPLILLSQLEFQQGLIIS